MEQDTTYVAMDVSKEKIAVAIAEGGRRGEVRFYGTIATSTDAVAKLVGGLGARHPRLCFCYEAGPTGYGLYRQLRALGYDCQVVAPSMVPSMVPVRPGGQVKTDRRDATTLAALLRVGELTPIWVPDDAHEAMRDLVRARSHQHHRRRCRTCAGRASSCCPSCFATVASIRRAGTGRGRIAAGWPSSASSTQPGRSSSRS